MTKKTVDVETIDILLIGNEEEIAEGVRQINDGFQEKIVEIIRKKALSANEHDLLDIYQNVMLSILECAKKGNYDPDAKKLQSFIYTIAYRRAADWVRDKCGIKEEHNTDLVVESAQEIICGSKYSEPWQEAQSKEERTLILETLRNSISKLKRRQRQVAEVIVGNFPNLLSNLDIKNQILRRYGEDVTTVAVKSAKQEVYNKVKEALSITGYGEYTYD